MNRNAMNNLILTLEANGFTHVKKGRIHIYTKNELAVHVEPEAGVVEVEYRDWPLVLNNERDLAYLLIGHVSFDSTGRRLEGAPDRLIAQILEPSSRAADQQGFLGRVFGTLFKSSHL